MTFSHWSKPDTRWFLGVRCQRCQLPILFSVDHSEEEQEAEQERPRPAVGRLVLTCTLPACGHRADYTASAVFRFKKPSDVAEISDKQTEDEAAKDRQPQV
jgi:hypothetical protein